jgi:hypothetical protein
MQDDNIETIIDQLSRLTIQQEQLTEQIVKLQNKVHNRTTKATVDTNNNSKRQNACYWRSS